MSGSLKISALSGAALITIGCTSQAWAIIATAEQMTGTFSDPVYMGFVYNTPAVGEKTYYNNTLAQYFTTISPDGSTLTWGYNPPSTVPPGTTYSTLSFSGAVVPYVDQMTPTQLGTITYTNGTSGLNTLIFGATLTFSLGGTVLGSDQVIITTTSNQSGGLNVTQAEAQTDADYINICGNASNICGTAIQAYENTQGMNGTAFSNPTVAALLGTYTVDPGVDLTSVDYVSGDGVVGPRTPQGAIPEPSTWAMLVLGFAGLGFVGRRASRKAVAAGA